MSSDNLKNIEDLEIVKVEPMVGSSFDWVSPIFNDGYSSGKIEVIENIELLEKMSNKNKIINRRLVIEVNLYDSLLENKKTYNALIDTGSQETLISQKVISDLNLKSNGKNVSINMVGIRNNSTLYDCVLKFNTSNKAYPIECAIHNIKSYDIIIGVNILELVETHIKNGEFEIKI